MLSIVLTTLSFTLAPTPPLADARSPRSCPSCGVYEGPNSHLIYDPLLRQVDVWPEFVSQTCDFEVAAGDFVRLGRAACVAEGNYRARRGLTARAAGTAFAAVGATLAAERANPRGCPHCGVYEGPNQHLIYDPLLRQIDVWPEFVSQTCEFEVAAGDFVRLGRSACAAERVYQARFGAARGLTA